MQNGRSRIWRTYIAAETAMRRMLRIAETAVHGGGSRTKMLRREDRTFALADRVVKVSDPLSIPQHGDAAVAEIAPTGNETDSSIAHLPVTGVPSQLANGFDDMVQSPHMRLA